MEEGKLNRKKILVTTSSYPLFAGDRSGHFVHGLIKSLVPEYDVFVVAPWSKGYAKEEIIDGVNVFRHRQFPLFDIELAHGAGIPDRLKRNKLLVLVIPFFLLYQFVMAFNLIRKEKIGIVHAFWMIPQGLIAILLKKLFFSNIKIVCSVLGADINGFNGGLGTKLKQTALNNVDALISQSKPMSDKARELGYKKEVYDYPLSIDSDVYHPNKRADRLRKEHGIEGKFLLFVASLTGRKGIKYLIQAMPAILAADPKSKLIIIGDGDVRSETEAQVAELKIKESVVFLGFLSPDSLPEYFASCDIFILPSLSEGFPVVVISAISCGAVTLVTNLPVFEELSATHSNLLTVVEKENPAAISSAVVNIFENFSAYREKSVANRQFVLDNFSAATIALKYKQLLATL
jgi:glycosyltransferase involved in cell wall biosynthesis